MVIDTSIPSNTLSKLKLEKNNAYIDDKFIGTFTEGQFQTGYTAVLFARISNSGTIEENNKSVIYYTKIWDNNILVRHFIPCYRKSDGVIGMYDLVENKFYTNSGTGTFIKGNDI